MNTSATASTPSSFAANPFAMLLDPVGLVQEVERSERLQRLRSRVYRPLDKPLIAHRSAGAEQASFDLMVDADDLADDELAIDGEQGA